MIVLSDSPGTSHSCDRTGNELYIACAVVLYQDFHYKHFWTCVSLPEFVRLGVEKSES